MQNTSFDIVIIGAGPAGAIAAGQLASSGLSVLVVEANGNTIPKWGNLLPMAAVRVLDQCNLWERFQAQDHRLTAGNQLAWGNRRIHKATAKPNPHDQAYLVDRAQVEELWVDYALENGAEIWMEATFNTCKQNPDGWEIEAEAQSQQRKIKARFMIDASGTKRAVQSYLGIPFQLEDIQECWISLLEPVEKDSRYPISGMVESVENGWWYASPTPNGQLQLMFFTQPSISAIPPAELPRKWEAEKDRTSHLKNLLIQFPFKQIGKTEVVQVENGRTAQIAGEHWCAIGDAAIAFDPLSSQGLLSALYAGIRIKEPVAQWLRGNRQPMAQYTENQMAIYQSYLANHTQLYLEEKRWPQSPFWKQRQTRST